MKKNIGLLAVVILVLTLVGFAFEQIAPARAVHAAAEPQAARYAAEPASPEKQPDAAPAAQPAHPFVFLAAGLIFILFGMLAVVPLLIGDPSALPQGGRRLL